MGIIAAYQQTRRMTMPASLGRIHAAPTANGPKGRARFPDILASLRENEGLASKLTENLATVVASTEVEAKAADASKVRAIIDEIEADERRLAAERRLTLGTFARDRVVLRRKEPGALSEYGRLADRYRDSMNPVQAAIRDARWQLMCIAAELERGDEGPVFDDPRALRRHLNAMFRARSCRRESARRVRFADDPVGRETSSWGIRRSVRCRGRSAD
ncbi:MAG: hypothetical protein EXQ94_11735 [Alphaproteobacteria bacterium]|nr:hypothetical protein [Alphaproteobacteria bacterium]